ncbi:DNA-binding transcriptional LysR family regulator [Virgibacillus natechei]|uniref:DNA-binding transcriptional LysR family regulator n=1 Tax=Virgibacillus natechei TaxID=1216297 RepID=A0ABS4ILD1_9BACI|nr:LysR family transcriptional regulator [Virgibacillus natechei]MBP1971715.1 DNA-binding transcriptional LysR family regulator [Virgibacillus natechei]UZD12148.1 LysR family transcriptional regulator [Virgibacillus natechei]
MNESQLQTFLTVAKYKSYSKAAVILNVTQPTITSRIKALEDILQCELFKRIGHEIFLTKEGNMFIDYANNILIYITHSKEITNMVKDPVIKVGFSPGYAYSFIIELLKTIKSTGDIDIQVIEGHDSVSLNERVLSGEIDLIFSRDVLSNNQNLISEYLFDNNLVLVLPANHHLCEKQTLQIDDLNGESIISYSRNSSLWKLIDEQLIRAQNITRIDVDNNEMLLKAVANEIGIGIIPELGIDTRYETEVEIREISNIYNIPNKVYVQYRKNPQIESLAKKIIYSIIQHKYSGFY